MPEVGEDRDLEAQGVADALGVNLRRVRQSAGLTLQNVSARADVSKGYLSKVESGRSTPSIAVISKLVDIYGISLSDIFMPEGKRTRISVVRAGERTLVNKNGSELGYVYEIASSRKLEPLSEAFFLTLPQLHGEDPPRFRHSGEEVIMVLEGQMRFEYGGMDLDLGPGDCIQFDASIEHHGVAIGDAPARLFVVVIPNSDRTASTDAPTNAQALIV